MKIELKHLAHYLPYGLKYKSFYNNSINELEHLSLDFNSSMWGNSFKPVLRPLSDLTKNELNLFSSSFRSLCLASEFSFDYVCLIDLEICFALHIDVYGLIEKGLSLSIRDVSQAE